MALLSKKQLVRAFGLAALVMLGAEACGGGSDDDASDEHDAGAGGTGAKPSSGGASGTGTGARDGQAGDADSGAASTGGGAGGTDASPGASGEGPTLSPADEQTLEAGGDDEIVLEAGYAALIVPAGALAEPTPITLRHLASDTTPLDDVYEMLPSGLEFLEPATFVLDVGAKLAEDAGDARPRILAYVDGGQIEPLEAGTGFPSRGLYSGAILHFSSVGAVSLDSPTPSPAFDGFDYAQPYAVSGGCTSLDKAFEKGLPVRSNKEGSAAETTVDCYAGLTYVAAPSQKGQTCVSFTISDAARDPSSAVFYPSWGDANDECKEMWDDFQQRLADHEREHQAIGKEGCNAAWDAVAASPPVSCGKTEELAIKAVNRAYVRAMNRALAPTAKAQAAIDVGSGHGVTLNCDCECKDKCQRMDRATKECVAIECTGDCQTCVDGECVDDDCSQCEPATEDHCPPGSSWSSSEGACVIECQSGGTIAGLPCTYSGTATSILSGDSFQMSADVTLEADRFDGCAVLYKPISGTYTATAPGGCEYMPATKAVESTEVLCTFFVMPGASPYLVADCGAAWEGTITCEEQTVPTTINGVWLYTTHQGFEADGPIDGTFDLSPYAITFHFDPE